MTAHDAANRIFMRVEGRELTLERTFNAPRTLVFKTFSDVEHLKRWFGPKGWTLSVTSFDFRPGGVWHYCMKCVDESQEHYGFESWGRADYHEIAEPERIFYSDAFSDAEGNITEGMPVAMITLSFVEEEGKTKLINHAQYASSDALQAVLDMGMFEGISSTWARLDELLAELQ
ncbi:SRPBCC domain-containing protein [Cohnella nanjingensis]|uniref:SRPBCC domain-containing protein n=1 Tax=Cohnella nanjingensis TaxID=1387779 RepID=A0A7X0RMR1_9BACL|nr:SRPBCC domain-containing protein [Cohnella nanjingensis]MBB6670337.1 SRPBCC domain-containing protein [Cohnella nanjingensis]